MEILSSTYIDEFVAVFILNLVALASPGPDFAVVVQYSLLHNRKVGVMTALGIACGELVHITFVLLGIALIISQTPWLFIGIKLMACGYLLYLGYRAFRTIEKAPTKEKEFTSRKPVSSLKALQIGAITNILNPKAILFFLTLFTVVVNPATPKSILLMYGLVILITTFLWFLMIALCFSNKRVSRWFSTVSHWISRLSGIVFVALAMKLALEMI